VCPLSLSCAIMAATDAAPAVDPAPASEAVEEVKVDDKPEKAPKEKKAKAPKEKKPKAPKAPKEKAPKVPTAHPTYLLVRNSFKLSTHVNSSSCSCFCEPFSRSTQHCESCPKYF
jgi:hypothetical protein